MRTSITVVGLAAAAAAVVGPGLALAQTDDPPQSTLTAKAKVSPNKAGSKKKPRGVKLTVNAELTTPGDGEKPVMQSGNVFFPKGSLYNGGKFTSCSLDTLARKGLSGCPKKSIMGKGEATAFADQVRTFPKLTVVNAGQKKVCIWTVMTNPARVSACVPGTITKPGGKWAYKLAYTVPQNLQVVAGVPIAIQTLDISAGAKKYAKTWLATTSCPKNGKWPYRVEMSLDNGTDVEYESTTPCKG